MQTRRRRWLVALALVAGLAGCATPGEERQRAAREAAEAEAEARAKAEAEAEARVTREAEARAKRQAEQRRREAQDQARRDAEFRQQSVTNLEKLLPPGLADRAGWARDIQAALVRNGVPNTIDNACAIVAIIEQESSFRADPSVPNLPRLAWAEIERQREQRGIPRNLLDSALNLKSADGRTYRQRIDAVRTERELSDVYVDFIGVVPFGNQFLAGRNPVRTGGPMQVSIAFAETRAGESPYAGPVNGTVRDQVFTRPAGLYFGTAHLLSYAAPYDRMIYRFADYNAGRFASRNAAFQLALSQASGMTLQLDGDLLLGDGRDPAPSATEQAARGLSGRLGVTEAEIRRDLAEGNGEAFERSRLYSAVFALVQATTGATLPKAVVPQIDLKSPKFTRSFTTAQFATRVDARHRGCLERAKKG